MLMIRIFLLFLLLIPVQSLAWNFDGTWKSDQVQIHQTVGNRGQDIFSSNVCKNTFYTPRMLSNSNRYESKNFILDFNSDRSILVISSKDRCLPSGIYTKIK